MDSTIFIDESESSEESESPPARIEKGEYLPLYRAIEAGNWEKVEQVLNEDKDALFAKLNLHGFTALHIAIGKPENIWLFENLLEKINPEFLPNLVAFDKLTPLHYAANVGNTAAAEKLVNKNPHLLYVVDNEDVLPIERAIFAAHKTTFLYLLQMCKQHIGLSQKDGNDYNPFVGKRGHALLSEAIVSGYYEIAYDLLKDYPHLASTTVSGNIPSLVWLTRQWDAFPSAKQYNFYQRFVYSQVPIENYTTSLAHKKNDIENQQTYRPNLLRECTNMSHVYPVIMRIYVKLWKVARLHVPHVKHLHADKVKHNMALKILKFICEEIGKLKSNHKKHFYGAAMLAVRNNIPEVIEEITRCYPSTVWFVDAKGYYFSQISILNRCEHIYNFLVHEVTQIKYLQHNIYDEHDNNHLHLVGQLAPLHKLNMISGAALQMQRELQWFEEVSKAMCPGKREFPNRENETPIMVFRKEHQDLREKGEEWMRKTATSYTIVAALIITIVFAAAITVPGGNKGDTGQPTLQTKPSFLVFVVSDAISLFTSTTSLLLFLSILTARFAEEDFLYKLPKRLILGLVMLFMSVTSMMIAFSATLYIMFGHQKSWIMIPIIALTCLPIVSFVTLQLPLLVDLISSTYGRGIFGKQRKLKII